MKVISGCQTGADEAGLRAAYSLGIPTGGTMPKGWKTQAGPRPDLGELYGLEESRSEKYPPRTKKNVKDSDVTILFGDMNSRGCKLTIKYCDELNKPYHIVPFFGVYPENFNELVDNLFEFLLQHNPKVINVAGNREESNENIGVFTFYVMFYILQKYSEGKQMVLNSLFNE